MHVLTPFPYLGNGWTDSAETWCAVRGPIAIPFIKWRISARTHVQLYTLKHICSLPLVHRPKGVLLVIHGLNKDWQIYATGHF